MFNDFSWKHTQNCPCPMRERRRDIAVVERDSEVFLGIFLLKSFTKFLIMLYLEADGLFSDLPEQNALSIPNPTPDSVTMTFALDQSAFFVRITCTPLVGLCFAFTCFLSQSSCLKQCSAILVSVISTFSFKALLSSAAALNATDLGATEPKACSTPIFKPELCKLNQWRCL